MGRRMFSDTITDSASFLKMPSSSRLLYYDLGMNADDDGVVEAYTVMRKTGATEDDLKVLITKGFVTVLDPEDLIVFINQWRENNKIRADRKKDSIYKDLLLQIVPEVQLLESTQRADLKPKEFYGQPLDVQWTAQCSVGKCSVNNTTLHNITLDYYYYILGKNENFENSNDMDKKIVVMYLKGLDMYINDLNFDNSLSEETRIDYAFKYWAVKELLSSSHKIYIKYLTKDLLDEKYLKTCNYKSKEETKDFLDYFIKTLKNELVKIAENKMLKTIR